MTDALVPGTGHSQQTNLGAYTSRAVALPPQTGVTDDTEATGDAVNRVDPFVALSVVVAIPARVTLASGEEVVVSRRLDHRADSDEAWAPYPVGQAPADLTVEAQNDGAAQDVDLGFGMDLSGAKAEIRLAVSAAFSASGVDTLDLAGAFVFGGYDTNPAVEPAAGYVGG